jgi:FAD/FMN-containing dehydrogenase
MKRYESWGRYPKVKHTNVIPIFWHSEVPPLDGFSRPLLPFGQGRSYGDSCLNEGGILLDTAALSRFMAFDEQRGIIRCEAGTTFAEILDLIVPHGWFLPVTPGTKYVSVGGAIANDIHGKNHHRAGTFGRHVMKFELLRSNGERYVCSPEQNVELYRATIGGLGLTGLILWAEFQLKSISNPFIEVEHIPFATLEDFFEISAQSDQEFEYTVAWIDCLSEGEKLGRGIFIRGNHSEKNLAIRMRAKRKKRSRRVSMLCNVSQLFLNPLMIKAFNTMYYHVHSHIIGDKIIYYEPFFYPLDRIDQWNRMYGSHGFLQYQCVVPNDNCHKVLHEILDLIIQSGIAPFLSVLKKFGAVQSAGMLSFPRAGGTLALDFPYQGTKTLKLLDGLDGVVLGAGGAVYPAKDARMSSENFQKYYPQWKEFASFIDPKFSSSFWRRVTASLHEHKP